MRPLDLAVQDSELMPQQGVLGDQFGPAACQIRYGARRRGYPCQAQVVEQPSFEGRDRRSHEAGEVSQDFPHPPIVAVLEMVFGAVSTPTSAPDDESSQSTRPRPT